MKQLNGQRPLVRRVRTRNGDIVTALHQGGAEARNVPERTTLARPHHHQDPRHSSRSYAQGSPRIPPVGLGDPDQEPSPQEEHGRLTGTVVRGASLSAAGFTLAQAMHLATYTVLARLLTPSDFGVYAAATILLGFAMLLTDTGFGSAVVQRRDRLQEAAATAVVATFANGVMFGLVALAAAPILGAFFDSSEIAEVAAVMSGMIALRALSIVPDAMMQRRFVFWRRIVIEPGQVVVFAITSIVAASNDMGVWSLVIGYYSAAAADVTLTWLLARWRPKLRLANVGMWRELVAFGRHVFTATFILQAGQQADAIIVGRSLGIAELGQFRYGYRLASTPFQALLAASAYVLFPAFSRIAEDLERFRGAFLRSLRWTCLIAMPMSLILIPLGEPLAVVLFGDVWREAGHAAAAMAAVTAAGMIGSVVSEALKAHGRPDQLTRMHLVSTGLTISLMLAAVPIGFEAIAAALSIGAIGGALYALRSARLLLDIPFRVSAREALPSLVAAVIMAAALFGVEAAFDAESRDTIGAILILALELVIGVLVYLGALRLISPQSFDEVGSTLRMLGGRVSPTLVSSLGIEGRALDCRSSCQPRALVSSSRLTTARGPSTPRFTSILTQTVEALRADRRRRRNRRTTRPTGGSVRAPNRGFDSTGKKTKASPARAIRVSRSTTAPYVAFLDNDDMWMPSFLESMGAALDSAPAAGFAYTDAYLYNEGLARINRRTSLEHYDRIRPERHRAEQFLLRLVAGNFIMSSADARRDAIQEVGGSPPRGRRRRLGPHAADARGRLTGAQAAPSARSGPTRPRGLSIEGRAYDAHAKRVRLASGPSTPAAYSSSVEDAAAGPPCRRAAAASARNEPAGRI